MARASMRKFTVKRFFSASDRLGSELSSVSADSVCVLPEPRLSDINRSTKHLHMKMLLSGRLPRLQNLASKPRSSEID